MIVNCKLSVSTFLMNEAGLDLLEVTVWLWVTLNNFLLVTSNDFYSNHITKSSDLIRHLLSTIDSLLFEKIVLANQSILMSIFRAWLVVGFFSNLKIKILTSLNKWVISSSKSLPSSNKIEIFPKSSEDTNKASSVCNPKPCLQYA